MGFMAAKHLVQMHHEFPNDPDAVHALQARVVALIRADKFGADIGEAMVNVETDTDVTVLERRNSLNLSRLIGMRLFHSAAN